MSPNTRSCASNAVATSVLHSGGKGGSGSGKEGGSGGSEGGKGKSGGVTELLATGTAMSPMLPTTRSRASNAFATSAFHSGGKGGTENHTERIVQPATTDTGEHDERAFKYVYTLMRSKENITKYIDMMAILVQTVVTSKAFKKNRTKHPFSDWVTVSNDGFLILCLGNYEKKWRAKKLRVNNGPAPPPSGHEVEEPITEPRYTGKSSGTKQSWSKRDDGFQWLHGKGSFR
jgi:hypothetical protein